MLSIPAIAWLDYATGPAVGLSLLYLVPISAAAWWLPSPIPAWSAVATAAVCWFLADIAWYSADYVPVSLWNSFTRLAIFAGAAALISSLRRTRERLRATLDATQDTLALVVEQAPVGIVNWDPSFSVTNWNPAAERIFGYSAPEALGRRGSDLVIPARAKEHVDEVWRGLLSRQGGEHSVNENKTKDGRLILCEWHNTRLVNTHGRVIGVVSFVQDITEQARAVDALRASEERYRHLANNTPDLIYSLDAEGRHTAVNQSVCVALNRPVHEILGKNHAALGFPVDVVEEWRELHRRVFAIGQVVEAEMSIPTLDGDTRTYDVALYPVRDPAGRISGIRGRSRDVTERKQHDAERHQLNLEIAAQRQLLQAIINSAPAGIALLHGPAFVCELVNPAFEQIAPGKSLLGRSYVEVWPETAGEVLTTLREVMESGQVRHYTDVPFEIRRLPTGPPERAYFTFSYVPTRLHGRDAPSLLVLATETTERVRLEEQFRQAQKMEAVGRLAGGIAHDFNNLLTAILGYCDFVLDDLGTDHPSRADLEQIRSAGNSAAGLTKQLLAFSRKQALQPTVLSLNEIVRESHRMLRRLLGEDIEFVAHLDPNLKAVKVDRGQLEQVLMNLAVNARDAMPDGGRLTVETSNVVLDESYAGMHRGVVPGPHAMLAVSDTGCGMSPEVQARLFEPFFTTKEKGKGTGLGLATVYGIVKQSGGNIWVYSEPGRGTAFKLYLPEAQEVAEPMPAPEAVGEFSRSGATILLVEDNDSLRDLAAKALARDGYVVLSASHPEEALKLSEQHQGSIALLLTDVVLPGMSGRVLAQRLAPLRPDMRVLYTSGYTDNAIVHHGVLDSGTAYLQKPFTPDMLRQKVLEVLGGGQPAKMA